MQRFKFVPCRTLGRSFLLPSTQTASTTFRSILQQRYSIARLEVYARTLSYVRRSLFALSVPVTILAASALPLSSNVAPDQPTSMFVSSPDGPKIESRTRLLSGPQYEGKMALGAPQSNEEQASRVATPSHDAAALALEHVGARYRYGGASPRGFDCSGLTMYVYGLLGVELPHKASAQINERFGQRIDVIEDLAPGDLVFFKRTTKARGITHVALYVGDGMMVSANSPKTGVQQVSMYSSYWQPRFAGGLRPYREYLA